ncbi:MAG: ankyrin repeat domain-containing protein [Gemmatimonadetes bacterium]|nr:ankyrin repeat domain-containing protein [Gemmatimonadota bacterium]
MDLRAELASAAQTGDVARLRELLDHNRDFSTMPDQAGCTPLHYAAYFGHLEAARYLLSIGADPAALSMDPLRNQPLHAAATAGHAAVVTLLLGAGADPNAEQSGQWTPLHGAAEKGHVEVVRALLAAGARPGRASYSGATPRSLARDKAHAQVVALLEPAPGTP